MIHIPTASWAHLVFDLIAWAAGACVGLLLYRWRLRTLTLQIASRIGGGYFAALAGGAALGAWLSGSFNTLRGPAPELSHSIVGALVGGIFAVEIYKAVRGIKGSTGAVFVGSFATGVVIGRFGCLFAGLPDLTYGTSTSLPWAVDLGDGVPRHPVQIYESAAMAVFLAGYLVALRRREVWAVRSGFYVCASGTAHNALCGNFLSPIPR